MQARTPRPFEDATAVQRAMRRVSAWGPVSRVLVHLLPMVDRPIHRLTQGRATGTSLVSGVPVGLLTTTGHRSGQARTVPLVTLPRPAGQDRAVAVVGSNYGQAHDPGWVRNLRADPRGRLALGGRVWPIRAEEVGGPRRARIWDELVAVHPGYDTYARRAAPRRIGVFVLAPDDAWGRDHPPPEHDDGR